MASAASFTNAESGSRSPKGGYAFCFPSVEELLCPYCYHRKLAKTRKKELALLTGTAQQSTFPETARHS